MEPLKNLVIVDHPLVKKDVTIIRDSGSNSETFRAAVRRISGILAVEISRDFNLVKTEVETPLEKTDGYKLENDVVLIPILRAGLGMLNGFLDIMPDAKVGHIGLQRNEETLVPEEYYYKTPLDIKSSEVILLDPMLATGGSAAAAVDYIKLRGREHIIFVSLVAAPEGVRHLNHKHPDVQIYTAALDRQLNEKGYILPGLGDAGDRMFGTR
jgi:uracil phosphoribosyltransferase